MSRAIAAGVETAGNVAVGTMNYMAQKDYNEKYLKGVKETNQTNIDLAQQQNEWNKQQWERENAYNDPARQVQRLRGAGLSAAAAAQSIEGAGNASPLQSADLSVAGAPQPMQAPQLDNNLFSIIAPLRELAELRKTNAEAEHEETENSFQVPLLITKAQTDQYIMQMKAEELKDFIATRPYRRREIRAQARKTEQETRNAKKAYEIHDMQVKLMDENLGFLKEFHKEQVNEVREQIRLLGKKIDNEEKTGHQIEAETSNINQDTSNKKFLHKVLEGQSEELELKNILTKFGNPDTWSSRFAAFCVAHKIDTQSAANLYEKLYDIQQKGYDQFYGDPLVEDYFKYILNEGIGTDLKQGLQSKNTFIELLDASRGKEHSFGRRSSPYR